MKSLELLTPKMEIICKAFLSALDKAGVKYTVLETLRTKETQEAYFAQGRKPLDEVNALRIKAKLYKLSEIENKNEITWTLASKHIEGKAIDIAPMINGKIPWNITTVEIANKWIEIGKIGESVGLAWGGRWAPFNQWHLGRDLPHFEI